jgi:urease beta subunit
MQPGEYFLDEEAGDIRANAGRRVTTVLVRHTGDRPVQVGSHYHFFEVNPALEFNRAESFGCRLNVPAGTAVRFEPGEEKEVALVEFGGARTVYGHRGMVNGALDDKAVRSAAMSGVGADASSSLDADEGGAS